MSVVLSERDEHRVELAFSYAEDHLLSDVDSYAEWLSGECFGKTVDLGYVSRDPVEMADRVGAASVAELVALTLYPRSAVAAAACHELRTRYIQHSADWLAHKADDIRREMGE